MFSLYHALVSRNLPSDLVENVTTATATATAASLHITGLSNSTVSPLRLLFENTTIDDVYNITSDLYRNATNLYGNVSDDSVRLLNNNTANNQTELSKELVKRAHVLDRTDVRVIFVFTFSLVFCFCFFGKYSRNALPLLWPSDSL